MVVGTLQTRWGLAWALLLAPLFLGLGRGRPRELLLASVTLVLCLQAFDGVLRLLGDDLLYYDAHGRFVERRAEASGLYRYQASASYRETDHGDLTAMGGDPAATERRLVRFETDEAGYRTPRRETAPDLIVLGDSFAAALGSSQEQGVAAQLEPNWTTYNLSVGGAGPREQLLTLKLELPRIERASGARLLWLLFEGNDLDESEWPVSDFDPDPGVLGQLRTGWSSFRKRSPTRQLLQRVIAVLQPDSERSPVRAAKLDDGRTLLYYAPYGHDRDLEEVLAHKRYSEFAALFQEVLAEARAADLEILVGVIPTKARIYPADADGRVRITAPGPPPTGFARAIDSLCEEHRIRCLDLYPGLVDAAHGLWAEEGALLWWRDDTHWNGHGHETAAKLVSEALRSAQGWDSAQ